MGFALNLLLSALAFVVLLDLLFGLAQGRLRLLNGDRTADNATFWFYVFVEVTLVIFVALRSLRPGALPAIAIAANATQRTFTITKLR